jgi:hypothetical protein
MTGRVIVRLALFVAVAAVGACSGNPAGSSSNGTGGSSSSSGGVPSCRTYATTYATTSVANGVTLANNVPNTCSFDKATNQVTCTIGFGNGGPICSRTIVTWKSTADFVDEVQYDPPREYDQSSTNTQIPSGPCGSGNTISTRTNTYDSQRRLTRIDTSTGGGIVYTSWDSKGRPTAGNASGTTLTLVYDDTARTITLTSGTGASAPVTTLTYDPNGILIREIVKDGAFTTTTDHAIQSTAQVCK